MARLLVANAASLVARRLGDATASASALREEHEAALVVAPIVESAILLGRFQRVRSWGESSAAGAARRLTGGVTIVVGEGQVHFALSLRAPNALGGSTDPSRILNRHVRPLLRALQSLGAPATYGGRDFVAVRGTAAAWVGAAHRRRDGATTFEAVVAAETPFLTDPSTMRGTSAAALGIDRRTVADAIVESYAAAAEHDVRRTDLPCELLESPAAEDARIPVDAPFFDATIDEAIGVVGARLEPDRVVVGGDFYASDDALDDLGSVLATLDDPLAIGAAIDVHLGPGSGAMLIGVRSLVSIREAVLEAHKKKIARET